MHGWIYGLADGLLRDLGRRRVEQRGARAAAPGGTAGRRPRDGDQAYAASACGRVADEAELGNVVELADVARHLEEGVETGPLARPEAVAELLEVPRQEAGRVAVALARLVGEPLGLGAGQAHGGDERVLQLEQALATGSGAAQTANTIGSPVRSSQRRPRSWCGVGSSKALRSAASPISSFASASPAASIGSRSALGISTFVSTTEVALSGGDGDRADLSERHPGDELDRVDRALGGDAEPRQQPERARVARVLDRRDRCDVELDRRSRAG